VFRARFHDQTQVKLAYELMAKAHPVLLWALERRWTAEHAARVGCRLRSNENSAWLILDGRARVRSEEDECHAGKGEWMFPRPGHREQEFEGPFHFLSVTINWQWADGRHLFDRGLSKVVPARDLPWLEEDARAIIATTQKTSTSNSYYLGLGQYDLASACLLHELGARWARSFQRAMSESGVLPDLGVLVDPRLEKIMMAVKALPADGALDRNALAASVGMSPRHLDRLCKEATGRTLAEQHDTQRFEMAVRQLLEPGIRVKEVASNLGFADLSTFSRWFSRRQGRSPREFREAFFSS
jgi:AraC-like DNA-binding protein